MPRSILTFSLLCIFLSGCAQSIRYKIEPSYTTHDPEFVTTMGNLLGPPILTGNKITTLRNGDQIFPPMLAAIRSAKESINFETFVYWKGDVGQTFADALSERARAGVRVHIIIDWLGSDRIDKKYIDQMRAAGCDVIRYHAIHWYNLTTALRIDHRTHRKLLIVDGRIGFTGGVGIADEWAGDARNDKEYRDNHYMVEGPLVAQLQAAFMDNWIRTTGRVLIGDSYFPVLKPAGDQPGQVFKSSPSGGAESMQLLYLLSIAAARDHIRLASAYFIPDDLTTQALIDAKHRGVTVEILLPGRHIDVEIVRSASHARWGPLLKAGIEIYEYRHTMYHVKQAIFDDQWSCIGSSNLDPRSFRINDEVNLNVLDKGFAKEQIELFEMDKARSHRWTYEEWARRSVIERFGELFGQLLMPEL
jgi:cardiolipin synthase A/B